MDKYEYKIRAEEIKSLIERGQYIPAAEIADTIDWRRVKSVMMLCTISDLYKINRRYEDARDMLLLAYDRHPGGRAIVYSLCELSIKMGDFVQAVEYYKEFVQVAPRDTSRFILQYKLYEAQEVGLEERIAVLEEMIKNHDYREKWMYELAYLYHRLGLPTQCVEICDELILYFSKESGGEPEESKYVIKAMELKMLHQALSPEQQKKYDARFGVQMQEPYYEQPIQEAVPFVEQSPVQEMPVEEMDIQVKTVDVGQYNTINLQKELAEGLKEVLSEKESVIHDPITRSIIAPMLEADTEALDLPQIEEVDENALESEEMQETEVFFGETGEIGVWEGQGEETEIEPHLVKRDTAEIVMEQLRMENTAPIPPIPVQEEVEQPEQGAAEPEETVVLEEAFAEEDAQAQEEAVLEEAVSAELEIVKPETAELEAIKQEAEEVEAAEPEVVKAEAEETETASKAEQIFVDPEELEKQITGQLSIEDVLAEWERLKKENEEKNKEQVRQKVLTHTGSMFTEFEASLRDDLLEQLEARKNAEQAVVAANAANVFITEETEELGAVEELEEIREWEDVEDPEMYDIPEETAAAEVTPEAPTQVEEAAQAKEVVETEEVVETKAFAETEEIVEAEAVAETEEIVEAEAVAETEEVIEAEVFAEEEESVEAERYAEEEESVEAERYAEEEEYVEAQKTVEVQASAAAPEEMEEEKASEVIEKAQEEQPVAEPIQREKIRVRNLTKEERELFGAFIQNKSSREQLVKAIDSISMAAYTGNVIITGEEGMDTLNLAKNMVREVQMTDSNFSGKTAKISGESLNSKNPGKILEQMKNGALIIQKASEMNNSTVENLYKGLQQESLGIIVVLEDTRRAMERLLNEHPQLRSCFNARMDMEALSNESLVLFGRKYAREREYAIDEMGILALHTRIEDMQTSDHVVTVMEVKEIVDEAIRHANRKSIGHFVDILLAKRYDEEDMIILREKDFV